MQFGHFLREIQSATRTTMLSIQPTRNLDILFGFEITKNTSRQNALLQRQSYQLWEFSSSSSSQHLVCLLPSLQQSTRFCATISVKSCSKLSAFVLLLCTICQVLAFRDPDLLVPGVPMCRCKFSSSCHISSSNCSIRSCTSSKSSLGAFSSSLYGDVCIPSSLWRKSPVQLSPETNS